MPTRMCKCNWPTADVVERCWTATAAVWLLIKAPQAAEKKNGLNTESNRRDRKNVSFYYRGKVLRLCVCAYPSTWLFLIN